MFLAYLSNGPDLVGRAVRREQILEPV